MFMNNLSVIVRQAHTFEVRKLQKWNIGYTDHGVLSYLSRNDGVNQEKIAKYYLIDKGAIAKSLSKLEEKNFIRRETNKDNQREKLIYLTDEGRQIVSEVAEYIDELHANILKGITKQEREMIVNVINKISDNIREMDEK